MRVKGGVPAGVQDREQSELSGETWTKAILIIRAREKDVSNAVVVEEVVDMTLEELANERMNGNRLIVEWGGGRGQFGIGTT